MTSLPTSPPKPQPPSLPSYSVGLADGGCLALERIPTGSYRLRLYARGSKPGAFVVAGSVELGQRARDVLAAVAVIAARVTAEGLPNE